MGNTAKLLVVVLLVVVGAILIIIFWPNGPGPESPPTVEKAALQIAYPANRKFDVWMRGSIAGKGSWKDWGVQVPSDFTVSFDLRATGEVLSNDGQRVVMDMGFTEYAQFVAVRPQGLNLDTWKRASTTLLLLIPVLFGPEGLLKIAAGGAAIATTTMEKLCQVPEFQQALESILVSAGVKFEEMLPVSVLGKLPQLKGVEVRLTIENGKGVQIEPVKGQLSEEEIKFLERLYFIADVVAVPSEENKWKENERWDISAWVLAGAIDPSLQGLPQGNLKVRCGGKTTVQGKEKIVCQIEEGRVELRTNTKSRETQGWIEPRGKYHYSTLDRQITYADVTGIGEFKQCSKDHILFEAQLEGLPTFSLKYEKTLR